MNIYLYICAGLVSLVSAIVLTPFSGAIGRKFGFTESCNDNEIERSKVPDIGGIAILLSIFLGLLSVVIINKDIYRGYLGALEGIAIGAIIIMVMAFFDDRRDLPVGLKFGIQVVAAIVVVIFGVKIEVISNPFNSVLELGYLSIPITVLWIVSITNAVNMVDGLDGLAPGVLAIAGLALFFISMAIGFSFLALLSIVLFGSNLGFLRFNYPPASIILGNVGAYTLGFIIASASIVQPVKAATAVVLFVPILALAFPVIEISITVIRRLLKHRKVYKRDTEHLHHLLLGLGLPPAVVDWIFYVFSLIFATFAVALQSESRVFVGGFLFILMLAFIILAIKLAALERKREKNERPDISS